MSDFEPRLSIVDILTIELMRGDSGYARYCEGVDDRVDPTITSKFPKGARDHDLVENPYMPRLIAQRAKLYCEKEVGIPVDRHINQLRDWLVGLGLLGIAVLVFVGLATAIGGPKLFFDEELNANISWMLLLILFMFLISLISMAGLVVMLVQWVRDVRRSTSAETREPTYVLSCVWRVLEYSRQFMNFIRRREPGPPNDSMRHWKAVANRHSYFASAVSLLAINVYMLLVTLAVWGALYVFLFTNTVGYKYPNSLQSPQERAQVIAWFGGPVEFIGRRLPTMDAISWAEGTFAFDELMFLRKNPKGAVLKDEVGNEIRWTEDEIKSYKLARYGEFRRQWSRFLVGCVLVWLIAPRVVICLICVICVKCFYRDLLPNAKDDVLSEIVSQVLGSSDIAVSHTIAPNPVATSQTEVEGPEAEIPASRCVAVAPPLPESASNRVPVSEHVSAPNPESEPKPTLAQECKRPASTQPTSEPTTLFPVTTITSSGIDQASSQPPTTPRHVRVVGYELEEASYDRIAVLVRILKTARGGVNLNGAREQLAFVNELNGDDRVVVVASLLTTADDALREFVEDLAKIARVQVVLTDGTAAREEYEGQPSNFDSSLKEWKTMIRQAGLKDADILAYDLTHDRGVSQVAFALDPRNASSEEPRVTLAGRYASAIKVIQRHLRSLLTIDSLTQAKALQNLDEDLSRMYAKERQSLSNRLDQLKSAQQIQEKISEVRSPSDIAGQCVRAAEKVYSGLLHRLPTRWVLAGGLSGLAVGTVGGVASVVIGGAALLPLLMPIIVGHAITGAGIGGGLKIWLDSKPSENNGIKTLQNDEAGDMTLARCGVLQTLIYELQGNLESVISAEIGKVTNRLDEIGVQSSEELLTHFAGEMKQLEGRR